MDPKRCVILVPTANYIEPECEQGLARLQRMGYAVWRVFGSSAIDQTRNQMATEALEEGFEELMWIDSDIRFPTDSIEMLRSSEKPIICGIYPKKNSRELVVHLEPETKTVVFGKGGGMLEIKYAAAGFLLTHRSVYEKIAVQENLPVCNKQFGRSSVPYFMPMVIENGEDHWYLGEDFAFCERARRSGFPIIADTRIRLEHIGKRGYSWEDAGEKHKRYGTYNLRIQ